MKAVLLVLVIGLTGCSSYQASLSGDGKKIAIVKNIAFWGLGIFWGKMNVCDVNENKIEKCEYASFGDEKIRWSAPQAKIVREEKKVKPAKRSKTKNIKSYY